MNGCDIKKQNHAEIVLKLRLKVGTECQRVKKRG